MRLFLASQDFGNHADRLSEMVGDNRRSLVIFNARDYKDDKGIEKQKELFARNNLKFRSLDLRDYFGKQDELREFIIGYNPGLITLLGGNTFLLRRALFQSGLDEILRDDIRHDKYVLAGHSAGSMVIGPSLRGYERMDKEKLVLPKYQSEVIWDGLNLTDMRIIPHADSSKYEKEIIEIRSKLFDKNGWKYAALNDSDVFVVDNDKVEILR
jgi:dipeptidase E